VSIGTLVAFSWYTGLFFRPLRELSDKITALQSALAAAERVFTLYDTEASLPAGAVTEFPARPRIAFDHVDFAYEPGKPVLTDVSFTVRDGESIAIVGATGSGKSTIISLCNKFYLPNQGTIRIGDLSISDYTEETLRENISLISQDVYLFNESIAFNVALSPDFSLERVEEVCRYVNAHHFIGALKDGYLTQLKERGENLSAGQRQLLAFARALYHRPKILLLDEATSSVDTETESLVQEALDKILRNLTSIVVAHRLSTIQKASKILVMHKGRIREEGTHQELLRQGGIYRKLYELQRLGPEEETQGLPSKEAAATRPAAD
jgi:ATP-binding cassette subfamily B multidrug efflux pump